MKKPIAAGAIYIPKREFSATLQKALTVKVYNPGEDEPKITQSWTTDRKGYIGVPRFFGASLQGIDPIDEISPGYQIPEKALQSIALYDYQEPWVAEIVDKAGYLYDFRAMAATGKGKTVMALEVIRRLGATALVVVDQNSLKDQWLERAQEFLRCPRNRIGIVQGKQCEYEGKWIVIAMIQSLYSHNYGDDFYDYFGTIFFDEAHTAGAPQFSKALLQFPAETRIGISATPDRSDNLNKVLQWNLGMVSVTLADKHSKSVVRYLEHKGVYSWYANVSPKTGRFISELVVDAKRNDLICEAITWLWESGRDVLAISDRIEHLEALMAYCCFIGIPEEEMGIVAGYTNTWKYAKDPQPKRKPNNLWKPDTLYTPVKLQQIKKRTPKSVLDSVKKNKTIIFATYGMFSKGVDVPRLSGGIDCTPRSKAQQVHGRILRRLAGKKRPIWVTIRDRFSFRSEYQFGQRIAEYEKSNAEIYLWRLGKGVKKKDPNELRGIVKERVSLLKQKLIETSPEGKSTIAMKLTESRW